MAAEITADTVRARLVDGLYPPVRAIVVGIDKLEMECRELREQHGAAILPAGFWTRLAHVMRVRDEYIEEMGR